MRVHKIGLLAICSVLSSCTEPNPEFLSQPGVDAELDVEIAFGEVLDLQEPVRVRCNASATPELRERTMEAVEHIIERLPALDISIVEDGTEAEIEVGLDPELERFAGIARFSCWGEPRNTAISIYPGTMERGSFGFSTILHELGHAIGLPHIIPRQAWRSVMNPRGAWPELTNEDAQLVCAMYPTLGCFNGSEVELREHMALGWSIGDEGNCDNFREEF